LSQNRLRPFGAADYSSTKYLALGFGLQIVFQEYAALQVLVLAKKYGIYIMPFAFVGP